MKIGASIAVAFVLASACVSCGSDRVYRVQVVITSPLPPGNVPLDPRLDLGRVIRDAGGSGVLDPNSIEVVDSTTGDTIPCARTDDFAYGDVGRIEWVVTNPNNRNYEVRFREAPQRPALQPQAYVPGIGAGDLLRYNAGEPRPIELNCAARLVDLTSDGKPDLVGTWNYAYRPGDPWNGVVCYPRIGEGFQFADLVRIRHIEKRGSHDYRHFTQTYMEADFADFNDDGLVDLVYCPSNSDQLYFYTNSGDRDAGGMPTFVAAGQVPRQTTQWEHCRAVDLDADGVLDITIGNLWLRGVDRSDGLPTFAPLATLSAGDVRCFLDVDGDHRLDAITLEKSSGQGLSNFSVAWRGNRGGRPPQFDEPHPIGDINAHTEHPVDVTAVRDGSRHGLLVIQQHWETLRLFEHAGQGARFQPGGVAQSDSAVLGLGDQAWPCVCDWDDDGDLDLLVGGGYGWPRIVINDGTKNRPAYHEPQKILSEGTPIRITRNEILGTHNWHDLGYSYPEYVDWDADGLPDLMLANETNRIFWHRNIGTRKEPRFGAQRQVICDDFPDSHEKRARSALLADNPKTPQAPYPLEEDQPFYWRTGPAFADFNGDGLLDLVTADGHTRQATLFAQYRDDKGLLRLRKQGVMKLTDGRAIHHSLVDGSRGWTESFRAVDWDGDGLMDLVYSHAGQPSSGSIQLLRNAGKPGAPVFHAPQPLRAFGKPINITAHGPHPWAGDLDGDGLPDLLACVEWSVYPFFSHNAIEMPQRPFITVTPSWTRTFADDAAERKPRNAVATRVVEDRSTGDVKASRRMITGPGTNEHPRYPGCTGFVGWESVMRRKSGEMLCSFSAGYWHVSFPTPVDIKPDLLQSYQKAGFPANVDAPTGGRALLCWSSDNGKTWTRPITLVDTPGDDRHPVIVELADGSLLCVFFVIDNWYGYEEPPPGRHKNSRVAAIRSTDGGQSWSEPVYMPSPFKYYDRMCGKPVVLPQGGVLLPTYGMDEWGKPVELGLYRSDDSSRSWRFVSRLKASVKELDEPAICQADDGTIVMIARPDGEVAFSNDEGARWTKPQAFGIKMDAPCLVTLKDGTIVCIFGWGTTGGIQIMWSDDKGRTWTTPAPDRGFKIDDSVYVYAIGCEMPDGSIYIVYYDGRGNQTKTAIWGVRVRIRKDRQGIDILPVDEPLRSQ
jgi:hypothetical protein